MKIKYAFYIVLFLTPSVFNTPVGVYPYGRNVKPRIFPCSASPSQIYNPALQLPQVNTHIYHCGLIVLPGKTTSPSRVFAAPKVMLATVYIYELGRPELYKSWIRFRGGQGSTVACVQSIPGGITHVLSSLINIAVLLIWNPRQPPTPSTYAGAKLFILHRSWQKYPFSKSFSSTLRKCHIFYVVLASGYSLAT